MLLIAIALFLPAETGPLLLLATVTVATIALAVASTVRGRGEGQAIAGNTSPKLFTRQILFKAVAFALLIPVLGMTAQKLFDFSDLVLSSSVLLTFVFALYWLIMRATFANRKQKRG